MSPFKVVIAGGSLVGLSLALVFERIEVEYVLLEKGEIAPQLGASLGLHPQSLKILDQLGVWEDIKKQVVPLSYREHMDGNAHVFEASWVIKLIEESLKRPIIFIERCEALRTLYEHIKFKDRIRTGTAVVSYTQEADRVSVKASDGSTYDGDILIGADGIHSRVRQIMSEEVRTQNPKLSQEIDEGFTSEYKTLFGVSKNDPTHPFLPDQHVHNVYYDKFSGVAAAGVPGLVFWFLFVKTDRSKTPNCPRYSDQDAQELIDHYGKFQLGPNYTFKDLWGERVKASLVTMEEGVIKKWSHGRVLCMGDAVHKSTINPGLGGNLAFEGIAHFTNLLHAMLQKNSHPDTTELSSLFQTFYEKHCPRANTVVKISGQITRYEAQDSLLLKFASRYIVPYFSDKRKADLYCGFSRGAPHLEFLPLPALEQAEVSQQIKKPT